MGHDESHNGPYEPWPAQPDPWDAPTVIRGPQRQVPQPRQPQPPPAQAWPAQPPARAPQQQWAPAPPGWAPPPGRPQRTGNTMLFVVLGVVLVVLLAGGGAGYYFWQRSATPTRNVAATTAAGNASTGSAATGGTTESPGTAVLPPPAETPPATASAETPEQSALDELQALRADSLARVTLDGRWVAQIASKSVGITDPLQTAGNGSHIFYAVDILAESLAARSMVADPSEVYVLWGTDFGKRSTAPDGSPYWVTFIDGGFGSSDDVQAWCAATFRSLTPQELADTCEARQLTPPHD